MKKRVLSIVLTLALCLGLLPAGAWASSASASAPVEMTASSQEQEQTEAETEPDWETESQNGDEVDPAEQAAWAELASQITVRAAPALAAAANGGVTGAITRSAGGTTVTVIRDSATFTTLNVEFRAWTNNISSSVEFTPAVDGLDGAQFNIGTNSVNLSNLASGFGMGVVQDSNGTTYTFDVASWNANGSPTISDLTYDDVVDNNGTIYLFYRQNGETTNAGLVNVKLSLGGYSGDMSDDVVTGDGKLVAGEIDDTSARAALNSSTVSIPEGTTWGYHSAALRPKSGSGSLSVTSVRLMYGGLYYQVDSDMSSTGSILLPVSEYDLWVYYQRAFLLNVTISGSGGKPGNTVNGSPLSDSTYIFSVPENGFLVLNVGMASDSNAVVTNTTTNETLFDSARDGYEVKRFSYQFSGARMRGGQSVTVEFKSVSSYLLEYSHYVDNPGASQSYHGFSVMLNGVDLSRDRRTIEIRKGDVLKFNAGGNDQVNAYMVNTIVFNGTALDLPDFSWTRPASSGANVTTERNNVVLFDSAQNKMATVNITTRVNYAGSGNSSYPSQASNPNGTYTEVEFVEIYNNIKMNRANLAPKAYPDLIFYEIGEGLSGRIHNNNESELIPGSAIYPMQASGENPSLVLDVEFGYYVTQLRMGDSNSISPQAGSTWYGDKNYYANNGGGPLAQQNYDKIMANPTNRGYLESELINFQFAYHNDLSNDSLSVQDGMTFTLPLDSTGQATNSSIVLTGDTGGATLLGWKLGENGTTTYYPGQEIPREDIAAQEGTCVTYDEAEGMATINLYPVTTTNTGVGQPTSARITLYWSGSSHSLDVAGLLEGSYLDRDTVLSVAYVQSAIQEFVPDGYVLDPVTSTSMLKLAAGGASHNQFHLYFVVPSVLITFESDYGFEDENGNQVDGPISTLQTPGQTLVLPTPWDTEDDDVVFVEWSYDPDAVPDAIEVPSSDATYTAVYADDLNNDGTPDDQENHYSITFDPGIAADEFGPEFPWYADIIYTDLVAGQPINLITTWDLNEPVGYRITGWTVSPVNDYNDNPIPTGFMPHLGHQDGSTEGCYPLEGVNFLMPASDVVFTAQWDVEITFTSAYGLDGDEASTSISSYQTPGEPLADIPTPLDTNSDGVVFTGWQPIINTGDVVPTAPTTYTAQYADDLNNDGVADEAQVTITFVSEYGFVNAGTSMQRIDTLQSPGDPLNIADTPLDTGDDGVVFVGWNTDQNATTGTSLSGESVPSTDTTYYAIYKDDTNNDGTEDERQVTVTFTITGNSNGFQAFAHGGQSWPQGEDRIETLQTPGETLAHPEGVQSTGDNIAEIGWNPPLDTTVPVGGGSYTLEYGADLNNDNTPDDQESDHYSITFDPGIVDGVSGFDWHMMGHGSGINNSNTVVTPDIFSDLVAGQPVDFGTFNVDTYMIVPDGYQFTGWTVTPVNGYDDEPIPTDWWPTATIDTSGSNLIPSGAMSIYDLYFVMPGDDVVFTAQWDVEVTFKSDRGFDDETGTSVSSYQTPGETLSNVPTPTDTTSDGVVFVGWNTDENATTGTDLRSEQVGTVPTTYYAIYATDDNNDGTPDGTQVEITFVVTGNPNGFQAFTHGGQSWDAGVDTITTLQTPGERLEHPEGVESTGDNIVMIGWSPELETNVPTSGGSYTLEYGPDLNNNGVLDGEENFSITYQAGTVGSAANLPTSVTVAAGSSQTVEDNVPTAANWLFTGWSVTPEEDYEGNPMPTRAGDSFVMPLSNVTFTAQWTADTNGDGVPDEDQVQITFHLDGNPNGFAEFTYGGQTWPAGTTTDIVTLQTPGQNLAYPQGVETPNDDIAMVGWTPSITAATEVPNENTTYTLTYEADLNNDNTPDSGETQYTVRYDAGIATGVASLDGMPAQVTGLVAGQPMTVPTDVPTADGYQFTGWRVDVTSVPTAAGQSYEMPAQDVTFTAQWDVQIRFYSSTGFVEGASGEVFYEGGYQTPGDVLANIPTPLDTNSDGVVFNTWNPPITSGTTAVPGAPQTYAATFVTDANNDGVADGSQVTITFTISGNDKGFDTFTYGSQRWEAGVTTIETLQTPGTALAHPVGVESVGDNIASEGWSPELPANVPNGNTTYTLTYSADENNDGTPDSDETKYSITYLEGSGPSTVVGMPTGATGLLAGSSQMVVEEEPTATGWLFMGWNVTPTQDYANNSMPTTGGAQFQMPRENVIFTAQWAEDANGDGVSDEDQVVITFVIDGNPNGFEAFNHGTQSWRKGVTRIETLQTPGTALAHPEGVESASDNIALVGWNPEITASTVVPNDPTTYTLEYGADENNDGTPDSDEDRYSITYLSGDVSGPVRLPETQTGLLAGTSQTVSSTVPTTTGWIFTGWSVTPNLDYANSPMPTTGGERFLMPESDVVFTAQWTADANGDGVPDADQVTITFTIEGNTSGFAAFQHGSQRWEAGVLSIQTLQTPNDVLVYPTGVEYTGDSIALVGWSPSIDGTTRVPASNQSYTLVYGPDMNNNDKPDNSETKYSISYSAGTTVTGASGLPNASTDVLAGTTQTVASEEPTATGWIFDGWTVSPAEDYAGSPMPTVGGESFLMPESDVVFTAQWAEDANGDGVPDADQVTITFTISGNTSGFAAFRHGSQSWDAGALSIQTLQTPNDVLAYPTGVEYDGDNIALVGWNPSLPNTVPSSAKSYELVYGADLNNDGIPDSQETKYTITYEAGSAGAAVSNLPDPVTNLVAGQIVSVSTQVPTATSYEFTGWSVNVNGLPTAAGAEFAMPGQNVVFTAQWGVQITFESDHGFVGETGNTVDGGFQIPGKTLSGIPTPVDTDSDSVAFTGWLPAINAGSTRVPNVSTTYVAQYEADENNNGIPDSQEQKYAVIYAKGSVPAAVTGMPGNVTDVLVNSTQQVSDVVPTATGYVFDGWSVYPSTDYAGDLMPTEGGESFQMPQCNVTFTAQWAQDTNGDGVPDREQVEITFTISGNPAGFDAFSHGSQHWSAGKTTIVTLQQAGQTLVAPDGVESANDGIAEVGWEPVLPDTVPSSDAAYTLVYEEDRNNNNKPDSEEETYTITYDAGVAGSNVSNLPVSKTDVLSGTTQQVSTQQPTATGYRFTGWSVDPDAVPTTGGARYTMPAQNVTFTAKWDVQITFTSAYGFEGIGGYSYDGGYQTPGQPLANVPTPRDTETDKVTFTGWQPVIEIGVVVPEGPTVYIAQYADDKNNDGIPDSSQVTITFYSQRGFTTAGGATKEIVTVQELGGVLNIPDTPLDTPVDKVVFVGWSTDANAETGSIPTRVPEGDTTYYAIYLPDLDGDGRPDGEEELYNIIYDAGIVGSNAIGMPSNVTDVPGNTMQLVDTKEPSANGYLFEGWTVTPSQDYSGYSMPTTGGSMFLMPAENVTFTAQWEQDANGDGIPDSEQVEITFTITGNPAGFAAFTNGTQSWDVGEISIVTVQEAGQPLASPVGVESAGDNIALVGWNPSLPSTVPSRDADYTLVYSPDKNNDDKPDSGESKYTITYEAGVAAGASGLTGMPAGRSDLVAGQTVTVDGATPTATGYQFIGWSVNVSSVPTTAGASFTMPSQNVVFTAQWRVGITFTSDHGFEEGSSPYGPIYLTAGEILTGIPTPRDTDDDNVVFTGWSPAIEEGMTVVPNGATTYEALYVADTNNDGRPDGTETTYTITYSSGIAGITATMPSDVPGQLAGSPQTVPITEPSASGYIFQGWTVFPQRDYDGNPIPTTSGDTYRMPEQDVIFTALWSEDANNDGTPDDQQVKITFTITGNPNGFQAFAFGGSAAGETQIVTVQTIGQPLASPEGRESNNDGIALVGWNPSLPSTVPGNDAAYELVYGADANNNDTPDHQEGTYSITYEAGAATNAAGLPEPETGLLAGSNQNVASSTPTAAGWIFDGWQVNVASLPTNSGDPFTMPRENVVFTAQWQVDSNGDGTPDSQQVEITFISPVGLTDSMGAYVSGPIVTLQTPGSTLQVPTVWETPEDGVTTHGWDTDPAATMGSSLTGVNVSSTATTYYAIVTYDPRATQLTQTGTATVTSSDGYRIGQDYSADISSWFTDEDTANLTYGLTQTSGSGSAVLTGTILTYTPDAADVDQVVTLEVTASDGSATATVTVEIIVSREADQSSSKQIIYFVIDGQTGQSIIDHVAGTVEVLMPIGTDLSRLEPIVTHSGVEITPSTGIIQDFTQPVVYTVRAEDGSIKTYTVTVRIMEYVNQLLDVTLPDSVISLSQAYSRASIVANQALPQTTLAQMNEGSFNIQLSWKLKEGERFTNAPGGTNTYVWTAVVPDQMMVAPGVVITGEVMVRNDYTADWSMASGMAQSALLSVQDFVRKEG